MLSLRCSETRKTELFSFYRTNQGVFGSLVCSGTWRAFMWLPVRGAGCRGEVGEPLWSFRQHLNKIKTKDLGFNSCVNQNGPKFVELQKSSRMAQCTGSVPVLLSEGVANHKHFQIPSEPPEWTRFPPFFLTGVTQSGKRIKIMCAVTASVNCKSGNPAYPLPYWGDNKKLCKGARKKPDPSGVNGKLPMSNLRTWTRTTFSTSFLRCVDEGSRA